MIASQSKDRVQIEEKRINRSAEQIAEATKAQEELGRKLDAEINNANARLLKLQMVLQETLKEKQQADEEKEDSPF